MDGTAKCGHPEGRYAALFRDLQHRSTTEPDPRDRDLHKHRRGQTWHYLSTPVQGASPVNGTNAYNAVWEPEFEVDNSGNLVMFWSDETDPCCSQKIAQMDSSDVFFGGSKKYGRE